MQPIRLPSDSITVLEALASRLDLPDFDLLLIGDGSGTIATKPAGWACTSYNRLTQEVLIHAGAASCGTNNFAELAPYVQALWHHEATSPSPRATVRTVIVSDSEITVRCGNGQYARHANGCLWAAIDWFTQNGYELTWQHVRRNSNVSSADMDALAGKARLCMSSLQPTTKKPLQLQPVSS